ncbi:MAG TPA: alpha-hydroxy acid oxidase, partial [Polyangia bacterium]|nr:alpha-hydroxy acid oxidase [Polyangia bacterium]
AFNRILIRPRVLVDVSHVEIDVRVLGESIAMPIMLAPTAFNRLAHADGECAAARAAGNARTIMVASTLSTCTLEEIAAAATGALWFQLYVYKDREVTKELVARAERAGFRALVLTVDTPMLGRRERDVRNHFALPRHFALANFDSIKTDASRWGAQSSFSAYVHDLFDASLTWESVAWLRSLTSLPILLKGILTAEDARLAVEHGAAGVIVSNHGGRQLDDATPSIVALPEVVDAVEGRAEVLMDGGIRRGTDVLKALALGARAVLIGRAYLWGLAADGQAGVTAVLGMLRDELRLAMALAGRPTIASLDRSAVKAVGSD